jgi:hypothetical protein
MEIINKGLWENKYFFLLFFRLNKKEGKNSVLDNRHRYTATKTKYVDENLFKKRWANKIIRLFAAS